MQKIQAKESFQLFEHKHSNGVYSMAVKRDLGFLGCLPAETLGRP
ncbi:MAG: hypothetical protein Q8N77_01010 [Nanoarchaeota archaeon]|nr:hypothetical protein [Nanoarchaeota archaeon]